SLYSRRDLLEQLQPFGADAIFEHRKTSRVATRLRQARDIAAAHWIGRVHKYDRERAARLLKRAHHRAAVSEDNIRRQLNQFGNVLPDIGCIACGPPDFDANISADTPARFLQPL